MTHSTAASRVATPELSVVVPTFGRAETIARLLAQLARQSLEPARFEVVVVDDGSPLPIDLDARDYPFALTLLRQDNAGPGAARNRALEHCRAPWTLILNDDAVPAGDLLAKHLELAAQMPPRTALLGTFDFTADSLAGPFNQILQQSDLLFDFPRLVHDVNLGWQFFWTCNLSLPTQALRDAGGFDAARFREAIVEDVELGYRLAKKGWQVRFRRDLGCEHDHRLEPAGYFRRMVRLGFNMAAMYEKHSDAGLLHMKDPSAIGPAWFSAMQQHCEAYHGPLTALIAKLEKLEREQAGQQLPGALAQQLAKLIRQMGTIAYYRGLLLHFEGRDPGQVLERGPSEGALTSIVVVSYNALDKTRKCLEALRFAHDARHPTEIVFVDNGSTDGSAEWLAAQRDISLLCNSDNRGAPCARNQALARVNGAFIVVMDNDALVAPGWLRRLLHHAQVDAKSGCIGPVSDRAAHGQQIPFDRPTDAQSLRDFAQSWGASNDRRFKIQNILTSFCLLMRREVLDTIGAFDERFSPWGFEDDDFTLRATLAGFRNRIALDVFVRHEHYGGAKAARHDELLRRNWRQFAEKWSRNAELPYGDYKALEPGLRRIFKREEFYIPIAAAAEPPAALPKRSTNDVVTRT